ncbi:hypothetical protein Q5P01_024347 [Channa striata]|uniref:Uncharacterized protein n=1 Tax=Channa striata TaxID=64152 RepID=A0AA88LIU2_CHASR|nr:hypothetical protein Q5P01_024347 [Channa striata]
MLPCDAGVPHCAAVALCLEAGMLHAAHAWLLMSAALDSQTDSPPCAGLTEGKLGCGNVLKSDPALFL